MAEIEFQGETFQLRPEINEFSLMEFAEVAADGEDADSAAGAAAVLRVIRENLADGEWPRFRAAARKVGKADALLPVVAAIFEAVTERPTQQPSVSSDGQASTAPSSEGASSSPGLQSVPDDPSEALRVVQRLEAEGRPSMALVVLQAHEARLRSA